MKRATIVRRLTWGAWIILAVSLALVFAASLIPTYNDLIFWAYLAWITLVPPLATVWLVVVYRTFFGSWLGWGAAVALLSITMYIVMQDVISSESPVALFFSLLLLNSILIVAAATAMLLWYQDAGAALIACLPVALVWTAV